MVESPFGDILFICSRFLKQIQGIHRYSNKTNFLKRTARSAAGPEILPIFAARMTGQSNIAVEWSAGYVLNMVS